MITVTYNATVSGGSLPGVAVNETPFLDVMDTVWSLPDKRSHSHPTGHPETDL